ncbi:hypothetical protein AB0J38_05350 [Streptomyces sp. NPDC050095]|uniref:hypothetical protein n=1 Tax=unclassified Streptomyces TaxID=2593676 RepID=UPI003447475C
MVGAVGSRARAAIIRSLQITGLASGVITELVAEIGPLWHERQQAELESQPRRRAVGAGAKHKPVFVDRLLATGSTSATERRSAALLSEQSCTVVPGIRLRALVEVIEHLSTDGQTGIIDGTEVHVRRPAAGRKDREKFASGKNKQNAMKSMVVTDAEGRLAVCSPAEPTHHTFKPLQVGSVEVIRLIQEFVGVRMELLAHYLLAGEISLVPDPALKMELPRSRQSRIRVGGVVRIPGRHGRAYCLVWW